MNEQTVQYKLFIYCLKYIPQKSLNGCLYSLPNPPRIHHIQNLFNTYGRTDLNVERASLLIKSGNMQNLGQ